MVLPQVRINALALRNLDSLPFKQLQASNGPAPPTLAARARWLEHGLGAAQALTSAATAALAESVPSALVSPVRYNVARKDAGPPAIWIFGSDSDIAQASELLGEAFSVTEHGVWTSHAPRAQTDALFDALSRAVTAALEADGSIRLGADILDPASHLSYRFKFVLSSGPVSNVVLRVAVYQTNLRLVDADDTIAVLDQEDHAPLMSVVVAPLALRASLSRRKLAGDALSSSVLARWKEAGLLPSRGLKDSAVIFLRLQTGLEVPFPRACVLTSTKKEALLPEHNHKPTGSVNTTSLNARRDQEVLWRSRKRPRSPSATVEKREEQRIAGPDSVFNKSGLDAKPKFYSSNPVEQAVTEIPLLSSCSFSSALKEAGLKGMKDPTPVLHHPLARTPAPPPPLQDSGTTAKSAGNTMSDGVVQKPESAANINSTFISGKPVSAPVDLSKTHTSDLDMFGFGQDVSSGFGGNIDMNDVGSLDDDVGMFFGSGGMDSCLLGGSSPFSSLGPPSANHSTGNEGNTNNAKNKKSVSNLPNTGNTIKAARNASASPSKKAAGNSLGVAEKGFDKRKSPKTSHTSAEVLNQVLSSIAAVPCSTRGLSSTDRDAELKSFYEEDFTKRVTESLNAGRLPSEIYGRAVVCPADTRYVPNYTKFGSAEGVRSLLSGAQEFKSKVSRPVYIPKRRLKLYQAMARKNMKSADILKKLSTFSAQLESSSDEESDSDEEGDEMMQKPAAPKIAHARTESSDADSSEAGKAGHDTSSGCNSTRIAQNVAVDCASACMVLIEEFHRSTSNAACASKPSPQSVLPSNGSNSAGAMDVKSPGVQGTTVGTSPSAQMHAPSPKTPAHSYGRSYSNSGRGCLKKDKDTDAFLSLLQMQCIGVEGLQLFGSPLESPLSSDASMDVTEAKNGKKNTNGNSPSSVLESEQPKPVTTAVLRRVLYGFSRTIECSKALRSYAVDASSANCSGNLQVTGPLNLSDVYGDGSVVTQLETPQVCIGYNDDWIETSGDVLPLWEKSGLEPYSERKHVQYIILAPKSSEEGAKVFFRDVSAAYEECSYGTHTPMPGEHVTAIAIPRSSSKAKNSAEPYELTSDDSAMVQQYGLTIAGLSTKLASLRKTPNTASNLVVYIVSPFSRGSHTANAALLRAVSPLLNSVPGACASANNTAHNNTLPSSSWLSPARNGNGLALHVRVIPYEAVDRRLSSWMKADLEIGVPPRPQLVKGLAFSVYSSLRSKRLRTTNMRFDKENTGSTSGSTLSPDDQMSPMTPDLLADPVALSMAPLSPAVSPHSSLFEDNVGSAQGGSGGVAIDQSSALCPSYLHEPAVVLAGVGSQLGQTGDDGNNSGPCSMVLHLAYAYCKEALRYVFAWTDSRGEILDMASVPVVGSGSKATRRGAFWLMWLRGQRWRLPYVESTHVTISKLGNMMDGEVEDWDVVFSKILYGNVSGKPESGEHPQPSIVRKFTDGDAYMDHPTPATPAAREHNGTPAPAGNATNVAAAKAEALAESHGLKSITLCTMQDGNGDRLLVDGNGVGGGQDFLCVADSVAYGERYVQGKAMLGTANAQGVTAIEINVMLHYGESQSGMETNLNRKDEWDGETAAKIARTVAENFHSLRYVGSAPCWPMERWRNQLPVHAEMVRNYRHTLKKALSALQQRTIGTR